ncbi:MAG: hypothetical protein LBQ84_04765, partial [Flavobacteriaceae bacterium]|nr:hypothetical protein [Flavobacteriaceae bacterium]
MKKTNYNLIIKSLKELNNNELFYKEYLKIKDNPKELEKFLSDHQDDTENIWKIKNPELVSHIMEEEEFLPLHHNVAILKHNRYTPLFFHKHKFFEIVYVLTGSCKNHFSENVLTL